MSKEKKYDENSDERYQYLFTIFEQSWEYIRHAHTTFWQSFTAIFTVIIGILFFSYNKSFEIQVIGILSSLVLTLVGFFVILRIIIILREHFTVINRIRKWCGIDEIKDIDDEVKYIIPFRWRRTYKLEDFKFNRPEIAYLFLVNQIYIIVFAVLIFYLPYYLLMVPSSYRVFPAVISFLLLEFFARTAYRSKDEESEDTQSHGKL